MKLSQVKANMHKVVLYDGRMYRLLRCEMWLNEKNREFKYSLILIDKNTNTVIHAPMEKVEVI